MILFLAGLPTCFNLNKGGKGVYVFFKEPETLFLLFEGGLRRTICQTEVNHYFPNTQSTI